MALHQRLSGIARSGISRFEAVEQSDIFKDTNLDDLSDRERARLGEIEEAKQAVAPLFRVKSRKGKWGWPEHSSRLKFRARLDAVLADRGDEDRIARIMATQYRYFSGMVHGTMHQLIGLIDPDDAERMSIRDGPARELDSHHVFALSTACLLQVLRIATAVLGSPSLQDLDEVRDLHTETLMAIMDHG